MVKTIANASLIFVAIAGGLMTAVAARADEPMQVSSIELDGEIITIACDEKRLNDVLVQYARCQEIFKEPAERETAEQYCKPLAVAQACSKKSVPM